MSSESGIQHVVDVEDTQISWTPSVLRNFCEIPLDGSPYSSVELQTVKHEGAEGGVVLLRRRQDRALEIHVEPHLNLDRSWTEWEPALRHQNCHSVNRTNLVNFVCQVEHDHVEASCELQTLAGGALSVKAFEGDRPKRAGVFTPAPPGTLSQNPRFLVMGVFGLFSRSASIDVRYGADQIQPARFGLGPITLPVLEARFGGELILGSLTATHTNPSTLLERDGQFLRVTTQSSGEFEVQSSVGVCATGTVSRGVEQLRIRDLEQDWNPGVGRPLLQLLRIVRRTRRSPTDVQLEVK